MVEYDKNGQSIWGDSHGGDKTAIKTDRVTILINQYVGDTIGWVIPKPIEEKFQ